MGLLERGTRIAEKSGHGLIKKMEMGDKKTGDGSMEKLECGSMENMGHGSLEKKGHG